MVYRAVSILFGHFVVNTPVKFNQFNKVKTKWYARGTQKLVSTYDLPNSGPRGGGGLGVWVFCYSGVKTENTQSAKICLNFNFWEGAGLGVGLYSGSQNSKCQDLPKFQFSGGGGFSDLKFQRGALWRIWTQIYCSHGNLLVHHR